MSLVLETPTLHPSNNKPSHGNCNHIDDARSVNLFSQTDRQTIDMASVITFPRRFLGRLLDAGPETVGSMHYPHWINVQRYRRTLPGCRKRAIIATFVLVILACIIHASNPPLGSSEVVWLNLTSTIRANTAEPDDLRHFASLADSFEEAALEERNIASFCQRTLLPSIAAAESRTSSCKQQLNLARDIHTLSSRVGIFVSNLEKLASATGRLHHASKGIEHQARRRHDSVMRQLSGVGMYTTHGRVRAQDERESFLRVERRHRAIRHVNRTAREAYWQWLLLQRRLNGMGLREARDIANGIIGRWWSTANS
ncbi:hypothetical protein BU24DRAFT_416769 [Aaosphaeria arxii CBS 175.79]|uniref:Uncharacterized protein n=1 Tax=Aaosphaeria arxii CBS 175.79 TaxID=1450172 RepID=A0A6A5Y6B6_9PLEO|nr:uncharacterized protein BU24DRAFT_416769 [Aaosphaeria arxii CBS 175.79]KAF2021102.1 hypothetical protein BU24DRAFT_416769 [Aaosphaeria arxii CBS 175.79]